MSFHPGIPLACCLFVVFICCVSIMGCTGDKTSEKQSRGESVVSKISFESQFNGAVLATGTIKSQLLFFEKQVDLNDVRYILEGFDSEILSKIDYSENLLICVIAGNRPSSGYNIQVDDVYLEAGQISIQIHEDIPGPQQGVEDAETVPFEIISINRKVIVGEDRKQFIFILIDGQKNELARSVYSP